MTIDFGISYKASINIVLRAPTETKEALHFIAIESLLISVGNKINSRYSFIFNFDLSAACIFSSSIVAQYKKFLLTGWHWTIFAHRVI